MSNDREQMEFSMSKINEKSLRIARTDLRKFEEFIKQTMKRNNIDSVEEAIKYIEKRYYNIFFVNKGINFTNGNVNIQTDTTRSDFFLLKTAQNLKKHPEKIWEILDKMSPEERRSILPEEPPFLRYTPDMNANYKMLLKDISRFVLACLKIDKEKFISGSMSYEERSSFQKNALLIISKNINTLNEELKNASTRRITNMARLLDEYGELEESTNRYNNIMRKIGLEELQVEYEKSKKGNKPQFTTMKDLENPRVVEKLPLETQIGIGVFLTNRLAKIFSSFKKSKFILQQKGSINDISDLSVNVSDEELTCILGKFYYLQGLCRDLFSKTSAELLQNYQKEDKEISENIFFKNIRLDSGSENDCYEEFFDGFAPQLDNNFENNLEDFTSSNTIFEGIYERKDFDFHALIASLLEKDTTKINWGYIPEEDTRGNSIKRNKRMILIGVDFEGFNFPIRLHCGRNELLNLVKEYTGKDEIPVYRGDEDWKVESKYGETFDMTGQVIAPFDKVKRKFIKQRIQTISEEEKNLDYLLHLNWMINPNEIPEKRKQREVVYLTTGEISQENQKSLTQ